MDLGDDAEQGDLGRRDVSVQRIGDLDQAVVVDVSALEGPVHEFDARPVLTLEP
jgi:hypothetical protein